MAIEPMLSKTALDQSEENSTMALYSAAIGPISTTYYAKVFSRFEAADRSGRHWNWAAALNTLNWFAFRQLWVAALVYGSSVVGLVLLVFGIGRLVFQFSDAMEIAALVALIALAVVVPGLYANALLHTECRKKMEKALASNTTLPEACAVLKKLAPGRNRMLVIAGINGGLIALIAVAYFNFPQPGQMMTNLVPTSPLPATVASTPVPASAPKPVASGQVVPVPAPVPAPVSAPVASLPATAISAPGRSAGGTIQLEPQAKRIEPAASAVASAPAAKASAASVKPAVAPKPAASAPSPTMAPGFYINVGLFAEEANARKAHTKLVDAGLSAFVQDVKYPRGLRHRVRVGPFETQVQANAAADKIHSLDLEAVVFQQ